MTEHEKWLIDQYNRNRPFEKHINKISSIVDEILLDMDQLNLCYLCSNSEVCNSCSDDMERQMYNEELEE